MEFSFAEIFCWFGLCGVVYRSIAHENTPTFESEKDEKRNHLLRLQTAILFVPFVITSALSVPDVFRIFILIMTWKGMGEYIEIVIPDRLKNNGENRTAKYEFNLMDRVVQVMSVLPGVMLWYSNMLAAAMLMTSFSICAVIYIVLLVRDGKTVEPRDFYLFSAYFMGIMWIAVPLAHGLAIVDSLKISGVLYGGAVVVMNLSASWIGDAAAYYAGKKLGRYKATPNVSPGKSWAGYIALILFNILFNFGMKYWQMNGGTWLPPMSMQQYIVMGVLNSILGIFGDLLESLVKRIGAIKDSGTFFPGHGGILDRFDTFLVCGAPLFYFTVVFVGNGSL